MAKKKGGFTIAIQPQTVEEVRPLAEHFADIWDEGIRNLEATTPRITRTIDFEPTPEHRYPRFVYGHTVQHKKLEQITHDLTITATIDTDLDPDMLYDRFIAVGLWQERKRKSQLFLNALTNSTYFIRTFYYEKSLIIEDINLIWDMIKTKLMEVISLKQIVYFSENYCRSSRNSLVNVDPNTLKLYGFKPSEEFKELMVFQLR